MGAQPGLADVENLARTMGLDVFGTLPIQPSDKIPAQFQSLALLGPCGTRFWPLFLDGPEAQDGAADPVDRYSTRVISEMARQLQGLPLFPFGQTPPLPFISWALRSGLSFVSPVNLLVHARAGLWVSFRGAIALERPAQADTVKSPCDNCKDKPCLTACPAGALTAEGYDLPKCHEYLDQPVGQTCLSAGCAVRRACPVARAYGRLDAQSAHHMRYFHP